MSRVWLLRLLFAFLVGCAHRPTADPPAGIFGQLVNEAGLPLAGIEVQVKEVRGGGRQSLSTDARGGFVIDFLLDAQGARRPLKKGQRLYLSAWRAGLLPRELELLYPGGRLVLPPLLLQDDRLEIRPELLPGGPEPGLEMEGPTGASRSGRGE